MGDVVGGDGSGDGVFFAWLLKHFGKEGKSTRVKVETTTVGKPGKEVQIVTLPPVEGGRKKGRRR